MTLTRLIYKNNLRQENNGAVCSMMFEIVVYFTIDVISILVNVK